MARKSIEGKQLKRRSVTGCFTCRKRKKKCDERKPSCSACVRNFLQCTWPTGAHKHTANKLPSLPSSKSDSARPKVDFHISLCTEGRFLKCSIRACWPFESYSVDLDSGALSKYNIESRKFVEVSRFIFDEICEPASTTIYPMEEHISPGDYKSGHLDLQLTAFPSIVIPSMEEMKQMNAEQQHYELLGDADAPHMKRFEVLFQKCKKREPVPDQDFIGIEMEKFLFYACLQGYIPKMTTQYTHSNLTTQAIFIPQVEKNVIMKEVFLCCGATYLAWNNIHKFQDVSEELYSNCKMMISDYIKKNDNFAVEDWIFAALQLLCNRDKNALTGTTGDAAWHLVRAYDIIRIRYYGSRNKIFEHTIIDKLANSNLVLQPQERTLIESFIYQYSVSLFFVEDVKGLPSPFTIFKVLNAVLKCPVRNCESLADWMNNPILGSSLDSFEILAKLSFLGRNPRSLNNESLNHIMRLRTMCEYYTPAAPSKRKGDDHWHNFKINSMAGLITAKSCWLFATKLLRFDSFDPLDTAVQAYIEEILICYDKIPLGHSVWGILSWSLLVTGVFVMRHEQRATVLQFIELWSERTHSCNSFKISAFLRKAWASGDGSSFLFDRTQLVNVSM